MKRIILPLAEFWSRQDFNLDLSVDQGHGLKWVIALNRKTPGGRSTCIMKTIFQAVLGGTIFATEAYIYVPNLDNWDIKELMN